MCDHITVCGVRENDLDAIHYCVNFENTYNMQDILTTYLETFTATHCNTLQYTATQLISMRDAAWRGGISEVVVREGAPRT